MPVQHFYLLSHYICNGLFFLFSVCWLHVNEFNSHWERDREGDRRSWLIPMLFPLCWTFFQVSLMIRWYWNLSLYIMILSLCCHNILFFSKRISYVIWRTSRSKNAEVFPSKQESSDFFPPLIPPQRLLHSFLLEPKHRKRNNTLSQMRLRSVFKMRMSILSTATTEQMGYGIISFFVCFL